MCPYILLSLILSAVENQEIVFFSQSFLTVCCVCRNMSKNFNQRAGKTPEKANNGTKVENNGFEPLTPCLQSRCSSQLS